MLLFFARSYHPQFPWNKAKQKENRAAPGDPGGPADAHPQLPSGCPRPRPGGAGAAREGAAGPPGPAAGPPGRSPLCEVRGSEPWSLPSAVLLFVTFLRIEPLFLHFASPAVFITLNEHLLCATQALCHG